MQRYFPLFLIIFVSCLFVSLSPMPASGAVSARVTAFDPASGARLDAYEKLYLRISYESDMPLRFRVAPYRGEERLDFGVMTSTPMLREAGKHDTLAWISFNNATRIDRISVALLDMEWNQVGQVNVDYDATWSSDPVAEPRQAAEWVRAMTRKSRLRQELVFDPAGAKGESLYDIFFLLSAATIPFYLFLQVRSLRRWRGRWRELATVPIISITPLILLALFGFGMELRLWIIFIFRGIPLALLYLMALWFAKRVREKSAGGA